MNEEMRETMNLEMAENEYRQQDTAAVNGTATDATTSNGTAADVSGTGDVSPRKEAWEYFQSGDQSKGENNIQPAQPKNKVPGYVCAIIGFVLLIAGVLTVLVGHNTNALETEQPIDVYYATRTDEHVYALVQYMTESVAYYDAMENLQFYIVCDKDWNTSVVCLHTDELPAYQPYIDWLYSDSYENEPEEMMITGYAQPYDEELIQLVIEGFAYDFGEGIVDESNFTDYFGEYYLQVGQAKGAYGISNVGIYLLLGAVIFFVISGAIIYEKPVPAADNGPIIQEARKGRGILGALLGALLGGLAWAAIGALGYISGWIGILIIFFAYKGYGIFTRKEDKFGLVISVIFGLLMIFPATYLSYGWIYYQVVNENLTGYTTLSRALTELPAYMTTYEIWGDFGRDVAMGFLFIFIASMYMLVGNFSAKNKKNKQNSRRAKK